MRICVFFGSLSLSIDVWVHNLILFQPIGSGLIADICLRWMNPWDDIVCRMQFRKFWIHCAQSHWRYLGSMYQPPVLQSNLSLENRSIVVVVQSFETDGRILVICGWESFVSKSTSEFYDKWNLIISWFYWPSKFTSSTKIFFFFL